MSEINAERIAYLRAENDAERLSWGEVIEVQSAFEQIDPSTLPEPAENAGIGDMLDELEARLPSVSNYLTIEAAKAGIDKAVAERGEDYVYTDIFDQCAYVSTEWDEDGLDEGDAKCIVGCVFKSAGFDLTPLGETTDESEHGYLNSARPDYLADEAGWLEAEDRALIVALRDAQIAQDSGFTWGLARTRFYESLAAAGLA